MRNAVVDGIVRLRLAAMAAVPGYVGGSAAELDMTAMVTEALKHSVAQASHRHLLRGGTVAAHVTMWGAVESWYGSPTQFWWLDHQLGDVHAARWTIRQLAQWSRRFNATSDMTLSVAYPHLLQAALAVGLSIDSVQLLGTVHEALSAIEGHCPPSDEDSWQRWGLEVCRLRPQFVSQVLQLRRRVFADEPQHCWFGANARYLARERQMLEAACLQDATGNAQAQAGMHPRYWVIVRDHVVVGFFSAVPTASPYWGRCAGMDLCLEKSLRGRGLARPIYRRCLQALSDQGIQQFKGGTSQPAVMRLGQQMGRHPIAWTLRRGSPFGSAHFGIKAPVVGT